MLFIATKLYCNNNDPSRCHYLNGTIQRKFSINKGIIKSEFSIPKIKKSGEICEKDIEKIYNLTFESNAIQEKLWIIQGLPEEERVDERTKAMRELTEEEYNRLIELKIQSWVAECKKQSEILPCDYTQYLNGRFRFNECVF